MKDKIRFLICFVGGGFVSFLDTSLLGVCC